MPDYSSLLLYTASYLTQFPSRTKIGPSYQEKRIVYKETNLYELATALEKGDIKRRRAREHLAPVCMHQPSKTARRTFAPSYQKPKLLDYSVHNEQKPHTTLRASI